MSVQVRPQAPIYWRNTQVWLKGPVLKTGRSRKRRRGSNPFSSAIVVYVIAGWSSSVARWAHNPEVHGSNPCPATNQSLEIVRFLGFLFSSCPTLERGFGQILDILSSTLALLALFLAICTFLFILHSLCLSRTCKPIRLIIYR